MSSVTGNIEDDGDASPHVRLSPGQRLAYSLTENTSLDDRVVHLQRSIPGGHETIETFDGEVDAVYENQSAEPENIRFIVEDLAGTPAGDVDYSLAEATTELVREVKSINGKTIIRVTEDGLEVTGDVSVSGGIEAEAVTSGVGASAEATVAVQELGNGVIHKTVLTLTDTPITLTDHAGDGQAGGVKVYDFPAGNILILGAVVDAGIVLQGTEWIDTTAGDVGIGSVVKADGTALVTDEQDILNTTPIAPLVAQAGPIDAQSDASSQFAVAGSTDLDAFLNVRIDDNAAHVTHDGLVTGTVTLTWINLGDF